MNRYTFKEDGIVHVLDYKLSENDKLGIAVPIVGTYHFSEEQVINNDITLDSLNCMDCPFSYNSGDEVCYTHKGNQYLGLLSMLRGLHRRYDMIHPRNDKLFDMFIDNISGEPIDLVRFGVYGEPVLLPFDYIPRLVKLTRSYTGYTHQWHKDEYQIYKAYFMASTHGSISQAVANGMGWRVFNVGITDDGINCPASKEAGKKTTCAKCALCGGTEGKGKTNVFIKQH
jgi:hypothetical protein